MLYSNKRKQILSGWLKKSAYSEEYKNPLKLQKFLLFYELFSDIDGENCDRDHLRGWKKGPVFSNVWGDYTKERILYDEAVEREYAANGKAVTSLRAKKAAFLCGIMTENELSELTHQLHLWNCKKDRIENGEYNVPLSKEDFSKEDRNYIRQLEEMYPESYIDSTAILQIDDTFYLFPEKKLSDLTEKHYDILAEMAETNELQNPVYSDLTEDGKLVVD